MIRIALELLIWLQERGQPLNALRQGDLEEWFSTHPGKRSYMINGFLKWAHIRGLVHKVRLPAPPREEPCNFLEDDDRWRELHRCLNDDKMSLPARVAGALLFLYGLKPSRLVSLKADDIQQQGSGTYLTVGRGRLPLPPALVLLVVELRDHGRIASALGRATQDRSWLFHGASPGRPLSVSGLRRHLYNAGIYTRAAHNSALIDLAADLPAPVVAETLGIHIETAVKWSKYARRDWADYLAARGEDGRLRRQ
jgi:integrase